MARSGNIYDPKFIIALISISDISPWRLLTKLQNLSWRHISVWKLKLTLPACLTTAHCFESTLHSWTGNCSIHLLIKLFSFLRYIEIEYLLTIFYFHQCSDLKITLFVQEAITYYNSKYFQLVLKVCFPWATYVK